MQVAAFPQCCKAYVIHGFGGGHVNELPDKPLAIGVRHTKAQVVSYVKNLIKRCESNGIAVIFACPTSNQPEAIEALTECGFYSAPQEDLDEISVEKTIWVGDYGGEKVKVNHHMVPMFYLVKPSKKKVDYT